MSEGKSMTTLQNLSFPLEYFCDEVREGFFVSETMKRFWAAQLAVLAEIDKICNRHNINWYADSGTMLGAVRHKGYIPWDDDLDIGMFRDDYVRFLIIARKELSKEYYRLFSSEDNPFDMPFARIASTGAYNYDPERLNMFHGCPISSGVDIFPFDNIFDNENKEEDRVKRGKLVYSTLAGIKAKILSEDTVRTNITRIEQENNISISTENAFKDLQVLFENISQECNKDDSIEIAVMNEWIPNSRCRYFRSDYDKSIEIPFEATLLRVPDKYNEILTAYYGDYMTPVRGLAVHDYPVYRELEDKFRKRYGKNPTLRYHFEKDNFKSKEIRTKFRIQQKELLSYLYSFHENTCEKICSGEMDQAARFLETCQNAAVTIGNALEGKYEECTEAVRALENYCEEVYEASANWNEKSKDILNESLKDAEKKIDKLFDASKKEILFLLCRPSWWNSIKDVYSALAENKEYDIRAISIPYSFLDHTKNLMGWQNGLDEFEKIPELAGVITNFDEYRLETRHPDMIVIQFPYDGYSGILAIPENLFSDKLINYTDELVFVPYLEPDPPKSVDDVAYEAMQELVEQPVIFNADRVLIKSEQLREYYVKKLIDMTDESFKEYWNQRICLKENL